MNKVDSRNRWLLVIVAVLSAATAWTGELTTPSSRSSSSGNNGTEAGGVRPFPGYYHDLAFYGFANQKDEFHRNRYVSELDLSMDYRIFSVGERSTLLWDLALMTGMGEARDSHLPFASYEIAYRLGPWFEYVRNDRLYRIGWDHGCSHLVHKDGPHPWYEDASGNPLLSDVYYNRAFVGYGTPWIRPQVYRERAAADPDARRRWGPSAWYFEAGYYLRSFFDIIDQGSLYEGNDWAWDARAEWRYPVRVGRSFVLSLTNEARVLLDTGASTYWTDRCGLEAWFTGGALGTGLFIRGSLIDEHPRDSKDRIIEAGLRVFL